MKNIAFGPSECPSLDRNLTGRRSFVTSLLTAVGLVVLIGAANSVFGINAAPDLIDLQQPDGAKISLHIRGDEYIHWLEDPSGYTVLWDGRQYVYAQHDSAGRLAPTTMVVGQIDPTSSGLTKGLRPSAQALNSARLDALPPDQRSAGVDPQAVIKTTGVAPVGTVKNLVILCKFSDHTFGVHTRQQADYDVLFNKIGGDPSLAPSGSVHDYYNEASYGTLNLQSTVVAWVTLPNPESYYAGTNTGRGSYPQNGQGMVEDALKLVDPLINFGDFDANNDGFVDAIDIIHSGYGAETGNGVGIWSHKWSLWALPGGNWTSRSKNANGVNVKVYDYHTEPALWGTSGTAITRIGVICHETGHFFGLPDLYDTDFTSEGIGSYCLMANSWGFDGGQYHPPHLSAWCKQQLGFVTPTVVGSGTFNALQVETNKTIFRINNGFPNGEYLLIENRQPVGFETDMPHGGLAIWHIDENKPDNKSEGFPGQSGWPGNGNHYKVALLPADGLYDLENNRNRGDGGDVFHGAGVTSLTGLTTPNTNAYQGGNNQSSNNSITGIGVSGSSISFTLNASQANFTVSTSSSPTNGGTTSGGGTFTGGTNVTVNATPAGGFTFSSWKENGNVVSTSASYSFTLTGNRTLVANFSNTAVSYAVSTSSVPSNGGTTGGGGTFASGTSVTVNATPNSGFTFVNWTETGNVVSTSASYNFTLTGNRTLVANFAASTTLYSITTSSSPAAGGTTSGGGTFAAGSSRTVTATPSTGYTFSSWTENGNVVSNSASYTFTLNGNRILVANFAVSSGNQPNLTAYLPNGWSDKIVVSNVTGTSTDTPNLSPSDTLLVDWAVINNGTADVLVSFDVQLYIDGVLRTFWTAAPPTNANFYRFIQDYNIGTLSAGPHTLRIKADPANSVLESNESDNEYTRTIIVGSNDNFSARRTISGASGTATGSNIGATKEPGEPNHAGNSGGASIWYSWTAPAAGQVTFDTLTSNFDTLLAVYTGAAVNALTPVASNDDAGGGVYQSSLTFQAVAGVTYQIAVDGYAAATGSVVLHWQLTQPQTFNISVSASPVSGGTVSGGGTYPSGAQVVVIATATSGFTFTNWTEGGTVVSTSATYNFVANANRTLVANFTPLAGQPNLTPYQPSGWADKIVVSNAIGNSTDSLNLMPTDTLYIDWAVINNGTANINTSFNIELYLDGVLRTFWTASPPTNANFYRYIQDYNLGQLAAGTHTLRIKADSGNAIAESSEVDNEYTKTIIIGSNDNFANRRVLTGLSGTATGSNVNATKESGEPVHAGNFGGASIWYSWMAPVTGSATIDTLTSSFDTLLGIYTGTAVNNLTPVASNDDSPTAGYQSRVTFNVVAGVVYQIAIDGYSSGEAAASGNAVLHWTLTQALNFAVAVSAAPPAGGTVSGGGTFASGTSVTVNATANSGYTFTNWTENGTLVSTSANYTFTIGANRTLVANFIPSGGGQSNLTPYQPSGWTDKIVVSNIPGTSTDTGSLRPTDTLYIDWAVLNNGAGNITNTFTVELYVDNVFWTFFSAAPPTNANFYRYFQDYNLGSLTAGVHTLRIKADATNAVVESNEIDNEYTKTITIGSNDNFANREILTGTSGATTGSTVGASKESGEPNHAGNVGGASVWYSWTAPTTGLVTIDTYTSGFDTLLAVYTGTAVGSLVPVASDDDAPNGARQSVVSFNATAGTVYQIAIDGYSGQTGAIVLHWLQQQSFAISTSSAPANGGSTSGGGTFVGGTLRSVVATPATGFFFLNWTENGTVVSTSATYSFALSSNRNLVANFTNAPVYTITAIAGPGGTVIGGGTYTAGTPVAIVALPDARYKFKSWSENGRKIRGAGAALFFTVQGNRTLVATFARSRR